MKEKNKFIISIVPLTRIPLFRDQFFYYSYEEKISAGSLVKIPLGKRTIDGIVLESKSDFPRLGNIQLKKVVSITEEKFLTKKQLEIAQFISDYYFVSLGIAIKMFVPKIAKARKTKNKQTVISNKKQVSKIKLTKEQSTAVKEITKNSKFKIQNSKFLLSGSSSSGKTQVYFESIKKIIEKNSKAQILILLPELTITAQEIERYGNFFGSENIAILNSKISKGQYYKNWQAIKSGQAQIIIGTRQAISAPFKNLKLIIIDEEQDISFKQWDMNPHYDARKVAKKLAEIFQAKIVFGSATPRLESFYYAKNKKIKLLEIPNLKNNSSNSQTPIEIVDLKNEHWKNFRKVSAVSPISQKLESEIAWMLKNKFQTILFINHQGMSKFSVCTNCKTVLTCPDCERALTYRQEGNYECLHCKFETGDFPVCPNCQGMTFRNVGLGTEKIEKEIEKLFPSARIARADTESMKKSTKAQEKIWQDFSQKKINILIGTQMIAKAWDLNNVGLVGIVDADSLFAFPDFRTNETAFSLIMQAIGRAGRAGSRFRGRAIIQTYHPENPVFKFIQDRNYQGFYAGEIKERKALSYPPFSQIIKLTYKDFSLGVVETEAQRAFEKLNRANKNNSIIQIYPPITPYISKIRKRYQKQIIIKIKDEKKFSLALQKEIKSLPSGWHIDVDPISVI